MAIQLRRGNYSDLNRNQLQPGEFAVALDQLKLMLCFTAGSAEDIPLDKDTISFKSGLGVGDLDMFITPGIYCQTVASRAKVSNNYPVEGAAGTLVVVGLTYGAAVQAYQYYMLQSSNEIYYRRYVSSAWTDWVQLYPGVISGSNSNGRYVKYPDGTMICHIRKTVTVPAKSDTVVESSVWIELPASYIDTDYAAQATAAQKKAWSLSCECSGTNSLKLWLLDENAGDVFGGTCAVSITTIGRWK